MKNNLIRVFIQIFLSIIVFFVFISCSEENTDFKSNPNLAPWTLEATSSTTDDFAYPVIDENIYFDKLKLRNFYSDGLIDVNKHSTGSKLDISFYILPGEIYSNYEDEISEYFIWNSRKVHYDSSFLNYSTNNEFEVIFCNLLNNTLNTNTSTTTNTNTTTNISRSWGFHFYKY